MTETFELRETPVKAPRNSVRPPTQRAGSPDEFQSPPEVLEPLWPYLWPEWMVWEPACGKGNLLRALMEHGQGCTGSDVLPSELGTVHDFFHWQPSVWDVQVTNPPYRPKTHWLRRSFELDKPFALLLPYTVFEGIDRQAMFRAADPPVEVIFLPKRPDFTTPNNNVGRGWFPCLWLTWRLGIGQQLTFWERPAETGALALEGPA